MWDYVYYSLYIDNIDTGDQNAIQKYVYEQVWLLCTTCEFQVYFSFFRLRINRQSFFPNKKQLA